MVTGTMGVATHRARPWLRSWLPAAGDERCPVRSQTMSQYVCMKCGEPLGVPINDVKLRYGANEANKPPPKVIVLTCPACGTRNKFKVNDERRAN
jgi:RNase P subunit RPR2